MIKIKDVSMKFNLGIEKNFSLKLFFINLSTLFPFTEAIGKKDALPKLFFLKCSISFLASSSVSVTMF